MKQRLVPLLLVLVQAALVGLAVPSSRGLALAIAAVALVSWHPKLNVPLGATAALACAAALAIPAAMVAIPEPSSSTVASIPRGPWGRVGPSYGEDIPLRVAHFLLAAQAALLFRRTARPAQLVQLLLAMATVTALSYYEPAVWRDTLTANGVLFAAAAALYADAMRIRGDEVCRRRRRVLTIAVLIIVAASSSLSRQLFAQIVQLRRALASQLSAQQSRASSVGFATDGGLYNMSRQKRTHSLLPTLRVFCQDSPGYLRGRVYDRFDGVRWHSDVPVHRTSAAGPDAQHPATLPENRLFVVRQQGGPWQTFHLKSEPGLAGFFFLPLEAGLLEVTGSRIAVDQHDIVVRGPGALEYRWHAGRPFAERPANAYLESLRQPFPRLDPRVDQLANRLFRGSNTLAERIDAVRSYFRDNYLYSLDGFDTPDSTDSVSHFLLEQPPGHCEYFATGTIALLRTQGVPCRYATGFLVLELEDENEEYWVARNRDAHAWVEAFDNESQRWLVVESTPGIELAAQRQTDKNAGGQGGSNAQSNPGLVLWNSGLSAVKELLRSPTYVLGLITLVLLIRYLMIHRRDSKGALEAMRLWLERGLRRRGLVRRPSETLHQFSARIEAERKEEDDWLRRAARWLRQYASVRYGGEPPESLANPRKATACADEAAPGAAL